MASAASAGTSQGHRLYAVLGVSTDADEAAIRRAGETLQLLDPAKGQPAPPPRQNNRHLYTDQSPLDLVPFAAKVQLLETINQAARARDPRVAQVSASLSGSWSVVEVVRPDGFLATDVRPLVRLNVSIVAEANGRRETGSFGMGGRWLYDDLLKPESWNRAIDAALAQALTNLDSVDAPAGEMTVLLGPGWPGVLLHEAVGHGLEGDFNRKGTSAFSGRIGERVGAAGVTVVDDGSIAGRRGSLSIDDEGTPTGETVLIEDGILKGYMQDRLNARLMGVPATGNGRRESYAHAPMPRMTNTFMKGGQDDPAELLAILVGAGLVQPVWHSFEAAPLPSAARFNRVAAELLSDGGEAGEHLVPLAVLGKRLDRRPLRRSADPRGDRQSRTTIAFEIDPNPPAGDATDSAMSVFDDLAPGFGFEFGNVSVLMVDPNRTVGDLAGEKFSGVFADASFSELSFTIFRHACTAARSDTTTDWIAACRRVHSVLEEAQQSNVFALATAMEAAPGLALADGRWHHVAFTRDRATGRIVLYVDGAAVGEAIAGTKVLDAPPQLVVGRSAPGGRGFRGDLDELVFFDRALSAADLVAAIAGFQPH